MGLQLPNIRTPEECIMWAKFYRHMADEIERRAEQLSRRNSVHMRDKTATFAAIQYVDYFLKKDETAEICLSKARIHGHDPFQISVIAEARRTKWRKANREKRDNAIRKLARKPAWTQERIAKKFGLSRGRVQQIIKE